MTESTRRSYDRVAAKYAVHIGDELAGKPLDIGLLGAFASMVTGPVLDVGAGPGHIAEYLARHGTRTVSTDLSSAMCGLAADRGLPALVADMTALPFASQSAGGIICFYAVIHLDAQARAAAYAAFMRVLRPGGLAFIAFHTRDPEHPTGAESIVSDWWDEPVTLTFRFLDPAAETAALVAAGFELRARLDRAPGEDEHPSDRSYLIVRRPA